MVSFITGCDCGLIKLQLEGEPVMRAYCHCDSCKEVHQVTVHEMTTWRPAQLEVIEGDDELLEYQHSKRQMTRYHCPECNIAVFTMNGSHQMVVSAGRFRESPSDALPVELRPERHLHYRQRRFLIHDSLPKFLGDSHSELWDP